MIEVLGVPHIPVCIYICSTLCMVIYQFLGTLVVCLLFGPRFLHHRNKTQGLNIHILRYAEGLPGIRV